MGKDIHFEIKGIKEVNEALARLPKELSEKVLLDINKAAGKIVQAELKGAVPDGVSNKNSKDKLSENIVVKKSKTRTGVFVGFTKRAWYVKLIEQGTKVRELLGRGKYKKGTKRGRIQRRPFIQQAHQTAYPKAVDYFVTNYLKIVNKSLKRLKRKYK